MQSNEDIREYWRPKRVRVLFVGESPPAGGTFFYRGNSNLFRYTREAFGRALRRDWGQEPASFLEFFSGCGCYLDDLCPFPVNHLAVRERRRLCLENSKELARRLMEMRPELVIAVKRDIEDPLRKALVVADLQDIPVQALRFPTFGHQERYVAALADIIGEYWASVGKQLGV